VFPDKVQPTRASSNDSRDDDHELNDVCPAGPGNNPGAGPFCTIPIVEPVVAEGTIWGDWPVNKPKRP